MAMSRTGKIVLIVSGIVIALVVVALIGLALIFTALRKGPPAISDNSVLALKISGPLPDYCSVAGQGPAGTASKRRKQPTVGQGDRQKPGRKDWHFRPSQRA